MPAVYKLGLWIFGIRWKGDWKFKQLMEWTFLEIGPKPWTWRSLNKGKVNLGLYYLRCLLFCPAVTEIINFLMVRFLLYPKSNPQSNLAPPPGTAPTSKLPISVPTDGEMRDAGRICARKSFQSWTMVDTTSHVPHEDGYYIILYYSCTGLHNHLARFQK